MSPILNSKRSSMPPTKTNSVNGFASSTAELQRLITLFPSISALPFYSKSTSTNQDPNQTTNISVLNKTSSSSSTPLSHVLSKTVTYLLQTKYRQQMQSSKYLPRLVETTSDQVILISPCYMYPLCSLIQSVDIFLCVVRSFIM